MAITDNWEAGWHFNNDWTDASGNGINGSAIGATFSSSVKKLGGYSSAYDGIDDSGNFGNVLNSVFAGADKKFSFSFWVYLNNLTTNQVVFGKVGNANHSEDQRQFLLQVLTTGVIRLVSYYSLTGIDYRIWSTPASTITTGTWQLVRVNYDGSVDTNDGLDRASIKVDNANQTIGLASLGSLGDIPTGTARISTGGL